MSRRIIRWQELKSKVGKSRSQIWRDERNGLFPQRRKLGQNSVGWMEDEIDKWVSSRPLVVEKGGK